MIASLSIILICQLIGEVIVRGLRLPLPGPVIGLALLFALMILRDRYTALARGPLRDNAVEGTAKGMLAHLSLLFVPAGVGVVQNLDLLAQRGVAIALVLAASVVVTLLVTAGTFLIISRLMVRRRQSP
ncbi:CidA/LrgA family protein [Afipia massiliensis]|uniref:CidA/LrgA family protein n=1 Tax=Afipia massiliensis TaxID=211460 RepID=A0A4U6BKG5_9BRAD|nr:CidA/LrgA family protein [Afipia massiliensis]TKT70637.1 CidA/LrgA family protein [Afipia massiliensis]